jgi:hypothetical protein
MSLLNFRSNEIDFKKLLLSNLFFRQSESVKWHRTEADFWIRNSDAGDNCVIWSILSPPRSLHQNTIKIADDRDTLSQSSLKDLWLIWNNNRTRKLSPSCGIGVTSSGIATNQNWVPDTDLNRRSALLFALSFPFDFLSSCSGRD